MLQMLKVLSHSSAIIEMFTKRIFRKEKNINKFGT